VIRIATVDDHTLFLRGLRLLIEDLDGVELLFEATDGQALLDQLKVDVPDVVLLDLQMPVMDGLSALEVIKKDYPSIKVILLTMHDDERLIQQVLELGANGYLLKNEEPSEIEKAIHSVFEKDFYLNEYVSKALFRSAQRKSSAKLELRQHGIQIKLTKRELEVLDLICQEYNNAEIAAQLYLSVRTVEAHRRNMQEKINVRNAAGLVIFAIRNKLVNVA